MNKNLIKTVIFLIAVTFVTLQSCEKKALTDTENGIFKEEIAVDNIKIFNATKKNKDKNENILVFNSPEDYENVIEILSYKDENYIKNWSQKNNFISMRKYYSDKLNEIPVKDDLLITSLLNKNGEIQIADKIFHLNFQTEEIDVLNIETDNTKQLISKYSFDDDVLTKVFEQGNTENLEKKSYCSGNTQTTYMNTPGGRVDCKVKYLKLGIYYKLYAKIKKANSSSVKIGLTTIYYNKTKYQNKSGCWTYTSAKSGYGNSYTLTAYSGIKRLKAYRIPINFWYDYINGTSYGNVGLNMSCGTPDC